IELALPFFKLALKANPNNAQFWYSHIVALIKLERFLNAKVLLDQAKSKGIKGADFDHLEQKLNNANKTLATKPNNAVVYYNMGISLQMQSKLEEAIEAYSKALAIKPDYASAYYNMGNALKDQDKPEEAIKAYNKALTIKPDYANAYYNIGIILKDQGKLKDAIKAYNKALTIKPDYADAYYNIGIILKDQGKLKDAIKAYNKALTIKPDYANAYSNMGNALKEQGKLEEAIKAHNKALTIKPDYADAYYNMGIILQEQNKLKEAIKAYNKALTIKPDYASAYYNMGNALKEQGKLEEAIEAYNKALTIKPDYADTYYNMGNALKDQGKQEEAIKAYNKALAIKPDYENARTLKLHQQAHICNWDSIAEDVNLIPELGTSEKHVSPFALLSLEDSPDRHLTRSKIYAKAKYSQKILPPKDKPSKRPKRIRIGYFSTDFKEHPVAYLIAKVLEQHNRDQFEVCGYSINGPSSCEMRQRLEKSFDSFTDVQNISDRDIALQARQDKIDIAVDLNGYTKYTRTGIFAYRAAPIQINYLGYPGTLGADFMDYIVADPILIPEDKRRHYSEQIIYLPNTYQPTDNTRIISDKVIMRKDIGLPDKGFVFCCFNQNCKISPAEFDIWMRLLTSVKGSVLWLLKSNKWAEQNLKGQAETHGVSAERIIFAERVPQAEHL
ncbi:tetratricopeptide repeat protein, partial [Amylibacter sp.]|nr:tetratricopeptide repeat protein [Amylibacter sp.]